MKEDIPLKTGLTARHVLLVLSDKRFKQKILIIDLRFCIHTSEGITNKDQKSSPRFEGNFAPNVR